MSQQFARLSLADQSVDTVMQMIVELTKVTILGASDVSVTLTRHGKAAPWRAAGTWPPAPCLDAIRLGVVMRVTRASTELRWPDWLLLARRDGYGSSLSLPIPTGEPRPVAALNIYSVHEDAFDDADIGIAAELAVHAGVALDNVQLLEAQAALAQQLTAALKSRAVIDQAVGITMATRQCDPEAAFAVLIQQSQDSNRKLRDVATDLVAGICLVPPPR